jgi:hypothetical protein
MVQSLSLCSRGVCIVWTGRFEKFLEIVFRLSHLALEIAIGGYDILRVGVIYFLVVVVATSCDCGPPRAPLLPFLPPLAHFFVFLPMAPDGAALSPLGITFPLPRTKVAPFTPLP